MPDASTRPDAARNRRRSTTKPVEAGWPWCYDWLMARQLVRPAAVAGTWYPGQRGALEHEVDRYLDEAGDPPAGEILAVIAPHAGMIYSGPVAAYAYRALRGRRFDVAVLVGPSHFVAFEGVAVVDHGAFEIPLGLVPVDEERALALQRASSLVQVRPSAHAREHSLEMQLPFLRRVQPRTPIVPVVMGFQTSETILAFADALATALAGCRTLLVASTDLSHYLDARTAARHDERVTEFVECFDPEALLAEFERYPEFERGRLVACGGGPMLSVMLAARKLGATGAKVLKYANSGDVSGDYGAVVGYMAAVIGRFEPAPAGTVPAANA